MSFNSAKIHQSEKKQQSIKQQVQIQLRLTSNPFVKKKNYVINEAQQKFYISQVNLNQKKSQKCGQDHQINKQEQNDFKNYSKIKFQIQKQVKFGEALYIVGNLPQLGQWDNQRAVRLQWNQGHVWSQIIYIESKYYQKEEKQRNLCKQKKQKVSLQNSQLKNLIIEYRYFVADYQKKSKTRKYIEKQYGWASRKVQIPCKLHKMQQLKSKLVQKYNSKKFGQKLNNQLVYHQIIDEWNIAKIKIRIAVPSQQNIKNYKNNSKHKSLIIYYLTGNLQSLGNYSKLHELKQESIQQKTFSNKLQNTQSSQYFYYDFKVSRELQKFDYMVFKKIVKINKQTGQTQTTIQKEKQQINYVQLHLHTHKKSQKNSSFLTRSVAHKSFSVNNSFCFNQNDKKNNQNSKGQKRQWSLCQKQSYSLTTDQQSDKVSHLLINKPFSQNSVIYTQQSALYIDKSELIQFQKQFESDGKSQYEFMCQKEVSNKPQFILQSQKRQANKKKTNNCEWSYFNGQTIINHETNFQTFKVYDLQKQKKNINELIQTQKKMGLEKQIKKKQKQQNCNASNYNKKNYFNLNYDQNINKNLISKKIQDQKELKSKNKSNQLKQFIQEIKANVKFTSNNTNKFQLQEKDNNKFRNFRNVDAKQKQQASGGKINKKSKINLTNKCKHDNIENDKPIFQMNFVEIQCLQHAICAKQLMINEVFLINSAKSNIIKPILHKVRIQFDQTKILSTFLLDKTKIMFDIQKEIILNFHNLVKWLHKLSTKHKNNTKVKLGIVSNFKSQVGLYLYGLFLLVFCQQDERKDLIKQNFCNFFTKIKGFRSLTLFNQNNNENQKQNLNQEIMKNLIKIKDRLILIKQ